MKKLHIIVLLLAFTTHITAQNLKKKANLYSGNEVKVSMLQDGKQISNGKRIEEYKIFYDKSLKRIFVLWGEKESWFYIDVTSKEELKGKTTCKGYKNGYEKDAKNKTQYKFSITFEEEEVTMNNLSMTYEFFQSGISVWGQEVDY